jgi:hypothetical protein
MEFDQILLLPPLLAAVYAVPRQRPTRVASLSITSFLPPLPASSPLLGRRFSFSYVQPFEVG